MQKQGQIIVTAHGVKFGAVFGDYYYTCQMTMRAKKILNFYILLGNLENFPGERKAP